MYIHSDNTGYSNISVPLLVRNSLNISFLIEDALKTCHVCILTLAVFRVGGNLVIERITNRKDTK